MKSRSWFSVPRKVFAATAMIAALALPAGAQPADQCPECMIGVWVGLFSANFDYGDVGTPIQAHVGYWSSSGSSVQSIEFSVSNLENYLVQFEPRPGATLVMGTPPAPSDTTGTDTGGMLISWDSCLPSGDVSVGSLILTPLVPVADDVLWVLRRFPPTVPGTHGPTFTKCGAGEPTEAMGHCFVVNPSAPNGPGDTIGGCLLYAGLAVEQTPWSGVKVLYR